ncbi:hypothetical protein PV327_010194 [Microctonus hyperodae]|uniref:Uncharacterized protein n=1 Tax=Microctonus hyperodae TaxID=165561 RepID=A0AA39FS05_MICHY|nr:hypothetical protein PV327_010194 [Microctonus hyperodae]
MYYTKQGTEAKKTVTRQHPKFTQEIEQRTDDRDTCFCLTNKNMDLTLLSLSQVNISPVSNHQTLLQTLCFDRYNKRFPSRTCQLCNVRQLAYKEFNNSELVKHKKWISVVEEITDLKTKKIRIVRKDSYSKL